MRMDFGTDKVIMDRFFQRWLIPTVLLIDFLSFFYCIFAVIYTLIDNLIDYS